MQKGAKQSAEAIAKISESQRARWQRHRERAALVLYAYDSAVEAVALADRAIERFGDRKIILPGSWEEYLYREAERAVSNARAALILSATLLNHGPRNEE